MGTAASLLAPGHKEALQGARLSLPAQGVSMPGGFCAPFRALSSQQTPRTQFLIHHSKKWLLAQGKKRTRITWAREDDEDEQPHGMPLCAQGYSSHPTNSTPQDRTQAASNRMGGSHSREGVSEQIPVWPPCF